MGEGEWEEKQLRLSESFLAEPKENSVELVVNLVNLNYTESKEITVEEFAEIRAREAAKDAYDAGVVEGEQSGFSKGEKSGIGRGAAQKEAERTRNRKGNA